MIQFRLRTFFLKSDFSIDYVCNLNCVNHNFATLTNSELKLLPAVETCSFSSKQSIIKIVHEPMLKNSYQPYKHLISIGPLFHLSQRNSWENLLLSRKLWLGRRIFEQSAKRKITHKLNITVRIHMNVVEWL